MDGLKQIVKTIEEEAEEEKKKIYKEAEERVKKEKSVAKRKADSKSNEIIEEATTEANAEEKRILSSARMEARRRKLDSQDAINKKVFKIAAEELNNLRKNQQEYEKAMESLIRMGGLAVGGGDLEVLVLEENNFLSEEEIERLSKDISEGSGKETSLKLLEELDSASGGAVVRKSDGSVQCDNTFEARLERMKDSLRAEIAHILFET